MAVKASNEVTVIDQTDAKDLVTWYQLSTSAIKPNKPTTTSASATPSGWTKAEPSYDPSQGTKYLYTCQQLVWGDGTCSWGDVQLSSSYEQAKAAWNAANAASSAAAAAQSSIDNLKVGGRNLLFKTADFSESGTSTSYFIEYSVNNGKLNNSVTLEEGVEYTFSADVASSIEPFTLSIGAGNGAFSRDVTATASNLTSGRVSITFTPTAAQLASGNVFAFRAPRYSTQGTSFTYSVSFPKLEKGNKATDWTPAPEDLASASDSIEYIEGTQTGATGAWTGSTKDSALYAGKSIAYKLPYAGSGNATLSLVLGSVDIPSAWTDDATGSDVTGVNLLKNSATMSVGTSSWANGVWRVAGGTTGTERSRVQITDGPNGSCYGVQGVGIQTNTMDATCWGIDSMPRTVNGIYTFSFYARVVGGGVAQAGWNVGNAIKTIDTNATETFGTAQYWLKTLDSSGAWTRVWATVCATTASANIYIGVIATDTTSKTVQICNVKIEKLPTAIAPVYLGTTRMTTHFGAGSVIQMTYDGANWRATSIPNTNNIDRRLHNNAVYAVSNITSSRLICGTEAGYRDVASSAAFDLSYPILYASAAIAATKTATSTYEALPTVNFSTTGTIESGAAYKQLYLKGTVSGNIFTVAASPFLTTVQPTTANGYFYIPMGVMVSATNGYFATSKDLYAYTDGAFRKVNPATIVATQKIYYRSNAESSGTGVKPNGNGLPTTWVTNTSNTFNTTATNASGWSTKVSPLTNDGVTGSTKYPYLWTCEQRKRLDGTVAYTDIVLDENTTVIDGGRIITNSITANKLNASNINASKTLTVGALTDAAAETILNSNVVIGGRNLLQKSAASAENLPLVGGNGATFVTEDGHPCYKASGGSTAGMFYGNGSGNALAPTLEANTTYTYSSWIKVTTTASGVTSVAHTFTSLGHHQVYNANSTASDKAHEEISSKRVYTPSTVSIGEWTYITEQFTTNNLPGSRFGKYVKHALGSDYTVYVRDMKLEKGNKATDWTPAPEDVDADISKASQTATDYVTEVNGDGVWVTPSNAKPVNGAAASTTSGWHISDAIELFRTGVSMFKVWVESNVAKVRIGQEDSGHLVLNPNGISIRDAIYEIASITRRTGGVSIDMGTEFPTEDSASVYEYVSNDGTRAGMSATHAQSGYGTKTPTVEVRASTDVAQVCMRGKSLTVGDSYTALGGIYDVPMGHFGRLMRCRIDIAYGTLNVPANSSASITLDWQSGGFDDGNYIVTVTPMAMPNGFNNVGWCVTNRTATQVTVTAWNSNAYAVSQLIGCIGVDSRYGSVA